MLKNLVAGAFAAGLAAGLIAAALQFMFLQPVLLEAELYEAGDLVHFGAPAEQGEPGHVNQAPAGDLGRNALSVLFSALLYTGYGLVLVAAMALAARRGARIDARTGLLWGVAGYVAVQLAPAAGLPPELPGANAAAVEARQLWTAFCIIASAVGVALIAFGRGPLMVVLGAAALLLPHLAGAPVPDSFRGVVPPELAGEFAARVLAAGLAAWAVLGATAGFVWQRSEAP